MTTADQGAGRPRDWKVTTGYRILIKVGWTAMILALYGTAVALVVGMRGAWWMAAGMAALALLVGIMIPAPVPREWITGGRNHIDAGGRSLP